jgi:hypothetical protein
MLFPVVVPDKKVGTLLKYETHGRFSTRHAEIMSECYVCAGYEEW